MVTWPISSNNLSRTDFYDQFRKDIIRYTRIGYNKNEMRKSALLLVAQLLYINYLLILISHRLVVHQT